MILRRTAVVGSVERGAAVTEFAIMSAVLSLTVLWSLYFYDILFVKLKVQEAARYAAWEFTGFQLSDYKKGKSGHAQLFNDAKSKIKTDVEARYKDLDSSLDKEMTLLTVDYSITSVDIKNDPMPMLPAGTLGELINELTGGQGGDFVQQLLGGVNGVFNTIFQVFQFNEKGMATVEVTADVKNKFMPEAIGKFKIFPSEIKTLTFKERSQLVADGWTLNDGSDVLHKDMNKPYYKQVKRVSFAGVFSMLQQIVPGWNIIEEIVNVLEVFLQIPDPFNPKMVSINYKGNPESGKVKLKVDGGVQQYHTSPMRYTQAWDDSLFVKVLKKRGDKYYMGCPKPQQKKCDYQK